jgi:PII-like signaling protein
MKIEGEAYLLRIFIGENDRINGKIAYKKIVEILKENDIAGATVLRGILGYGASSRIHSAGILTLSADLPVVIEAVDREEKIKKVIPKIENYITKGLITLEKVHVIKYV